MNAQALAGVSGVILVVLGVIAVGYGQKDFSRAFNRRFAFMAGLVSFLA